MYFDFTLEFVSFRDRKVTRRQETLPMSILLPLDRRVPKIPSLIGSDLFLLHNVRLSATRQ